MFEDFGGNNPQVFSNAAPVFAPREMCSLAPLQPFFVSFFFVFHNTLLLISFTAGVKMRGFVHRFMEKQSVRFYNEQ